MVVWAVQLPHSYHDWSLFIIKTEPQTLWRILNLKNTTGRLSRFGTHLIESDVEDDHCPVLYLHEAGAISRLSKADWKSEDKVEDVEDNIQTYCIQGLGSDELCTRKEDLVISLLMPTSKKLLKVQLTYTYCWYISKLEVSTHDLWWNIMGFYAKKHLICEFIQVIVRAVLCLAILYNGQQLILAGHVGTRWMYNEVR